ncbi:MAG: hypothetical protein P8X64_02400 [Anaerolineales bacterium]|jgi:hypothetical protein
MNKSPGIELLQRYADGEQLNDQEMETLRSAMYAIRQTFYPPRTWGSFQKLNVDQFMQELWPAIRERREIQTGLFEHGSVKP